MKKNNFLNRFFNRFKLSKWQTILSLIFYFLLTAGLIIFLFFILKEINNYIFVFNWYVIWKKYIVIPVVLFTIFYWWFVYKTINFLPIKNTSAKWMINELERNNGSKQAKFNSIYKFNGDKPGFVVRSLASRTSVIFNTFYNAHALIIGATGSGKTQKIVMPSAIYNSQLKDEEKPSMVFTDPKGELFDKISKPLKDNGYDVWVLNLADPLYSDNWNPLMLVYQYYINSINETNFNKKLEFKNLALNELDDLIGTLFPRSKNENPMWNNNAKRMILGTCQAMLEILEKDPKAFKPEQFNLSGIAIYLSQQTSIVDWFKKNVNVYQKSYITVSQVINTAEATRQGAFANIAPSLAIFEDFGLQNVLCKNNIDLFNICNKSKPTAIFLIVPDERENRHILASLFVSQLYKASVYTARSFINGALPRQLLFFLDEFGNMPTIPSFGSMVTVGRSRGIFFEIILQAFNQLIDKYGENMAKTIKGNCGLNIYIHTNDINTAKEYEMLLGNEIIRKKRESKSTTAGKVNTQTSFDEITKPLMDFNQLMKLKDPYGIVLSSKNEPSMVYMEYAYKFKNVIWSKEDLPKNKLMEFMTNYYYDLFKFKFNQPILEPEKNDIKDELIANQNFVTTQNFRVFDVKVEKNETLHIKKLPKQQATINIQENINIKILKMQRKIYMLENKVNLSPNEKSQLTFLRNKLYKLKKETEEQKIEQGQQ